MSEPWAQAFQLVFHPNNLLVMLGASLFGLFVGAVPGLTATMATALLVPVTFFMAPIPAIAAIVTATAMAIFSGDIPGCLLRMPGTPASAAYTDEAYAMTPQGPGRARARRRARLLGDRRPVRHRRADGRRAGARRVRAALQLVRVFLARPDGPDLRRLHLDRPAAQGPDHALPRPVRRQRRPQQPGRVPALHLRQHRAARRPRPHSAHDRHVRRLRDHPLRRRHRARGARRRRSARQRLQGHAAPWRRSTRCRSCAAARSAR